MKKMTNFTGILWINRMIKSGLRCIEINDMVSLHDRILGIPSPEDDEFIFLVRLMISGRSRDESNMKFVKWMRENNVKDPDTFLANPLFICRQLASTGLWRRKFYNLMKMAHEYHLLKMDSLKDLMKIKGVGNQNR